jgi:hypothetical protein
MYQFIMVKKISLIVTCFLITIGSYAQTAKSLYINMPDSLNQLLTKSNREDFADFMDSKMKAEVQNRFNANSDMKELTTNYLLVQTTKVSTFQMKVLAMSDSTRIICAVKTFYGPVADSEVHFYNTKWQELPDSNYVHIPEQSDFLTSVDTTQEEAYIDATSVISMDFIKADLSSKDSSLTFTYTSPETLGKEDLAKLSPFLKKEPVILYWDVKAGKFVKK